LPAQVAKGDGKAHDLRDMLAQNAGGVPVAETAGFDNAQSTR
jgi:hypothetical protein